MRTKTVTLIAFALAGISAPLRAATLDEPTKLSAPANPETDSIAAKFFSALKSGGGTAATAYIANQSTLFAQKQSELQVMATQIDGANKVYGPIESWEHVESEALGSNVRRDYYTVRHANNVVRWRIYFVRISKGWMIGSFTFDDQVQGWF